MHKVNDVPFKAVTRVTNHLDATSPQAIKDAKENANGYANVQRAMGLNIPTVVKTPDGDLVVRPKPVSLNWLGHLGPLHRIRDGAGNAYDLPAYQRFVRASSKDEYGRPRKNALYHGILSPPPKIQFLLWWLSTNNGHLAQRVMEQSLDFIEAKLRARFGSIPIQMAMHVKTARLHFEWSLPIYTQQNRKAAPGVIWDSKSISIEHIQHATKTNRAPPKSAPRLNSQIELSWSRQLGYEFRRCCKRAQVPEANEKAFEKCMEFLEEIQLASLQDRCLSRSPRVKKAAQKKLKEILQKRATEEHRKNAAKALVTLKKQYDEIIAKKAEHPNVQIPSANRPKSAGR